MNDTSKKNNSSDKIGEQCSIADLAPAPVRESDKEKNKDSEGNEEV